MKISELLENIVLAETSILLKQTKNDALKELFKVMHKEYNIPHDAIAVGKDKVGPNTNTLGLLYKLRSGYAFMPENSDTRLIVDNSGYVSTLSKDGFIQVVRDNIAIYYIVGNIHPRVLQDPYDTDSAVSRILSILWNKGLVEKMINNVAISAKRKYKNASVSNLFKDLALVNKYNKTSDHLTTRNNIANHIVNQDSSGTITGILTVYNSQTLDPDDWKSYVKFVDYNLEKSIKVYAKEFKLGTSDTEEIAVPLLRKILERTEGIFDELAHALADSNIEYTRYED
jgi:hypothetical protein